MKEQHRPCCAIILAAGEGTKMASAYPKALCQVLFKPMLGWVIDWCTLAGIEKICVVVGKGGEQIRAILPQDYSTAYQDECKGTAHAVRMAEAFLLAHPGHDVVVLNADTPFINNTILTTSLAHHQRTQAAATVITAEADSPAGYGRILRDARNRDRVIAIVEENDATDDQRKIREINSGAYWFRNEFLLDALEEIDCNNKAHEYYLTDTIKIATMHNLPVTSYQSNEENLILGANDRVDLRNLNTIAHKIVVDRLLQDGVNFYCMDGIVISPDVKIGKDTTIAPGTLLRGKVTIGADCVIGPNTDITDSVIGDGCHIHSSLVEASRIGNDVRIGPNSHLRPNSILQNGVKIGNFVEIKNSNIGSKTSVAHLTYIGDSDLGAEINVGCGVVTVNYNGKRKFRTTIKDHAFIGCNTNLVAPVTVEEGGYTAAGSTITEDVPAQSLAIARARQQNRSLPASLAK